MATLEDEFKPPPIPPYGHEDIDGEKDIRSTIDESFGGEEGILKIFKGIYKNAKGGSVPHAAFIMQWYFKGGEDGPGEPKDYEVTRKIIK